MYSAAYKYVHRNDNFVTSHRLPQQSLSAERADNFAFKNTVFHLKLPTSATLGLQAQSILSLTMDRTTRAFPSPMPGSLRATILAHPKVRLYIDPLLWTPRHLELLQVSVRDGVPPVLAGPAHRARCADCAAAGQYNEYAEAFSQKGPATGTTDRIIALFVQLAVDSLLRDSSQPPTTRLRRLRFATCLLLVPYKLACDLSRQKLRFSLST